ncbi:MAG: c-type cytochrome domain-containing protein, partial [Planctomycetota bacterium]|nr:c-type cytochrome domain-containing protein [Planctomycetota bacterium]
MKSLILTLSAILSLTLNPSAKGQNPIQAYARDIEPILRTYCYDCHNQEVQEGEVRLDNLNPDLINGPDAQRWHHALDM